MANYPQHKLVRQFFSRGQPLTLPKGEVVLGNEGTPNGIYFIGSGFIKIYSISKDGTQSLHIIYGNGELFPLAWAYVGHQSDGLFYETMSDCLLWRVSRRSFIEAIQGSRALAFALSVQLARQFQLYADRVESLEYKLASERVAYQLLLLAGQFGITHGDGTLIAAPITHESLASSINLARESVSRELERLAEAGIIVVADRKIVVNNLEQLTKQLDFAGWNLPDIQTTR